MNLAGHVVAALLCEDDTRHSVCERLSKEDRAELDKRVAIAVRSSEAQTKIREIVKKVLKDFYQTMYTRRAFWLNEL